MSLKIHGWTEDLYVDSSSASELAAKKGEKRKDMPPKAYWEG